MKISSEHYETLRKGMVEKHISFMDYSPTDYKKYLTAGYSVKRMAWDILHAAGLTPFVCDTLYKYLTDTHIDTAVKKIWIDDINPLITI